MKRIIIAIAVLAAAMSCRQTSQPADPEVFSLQGEVDTLLFSQVPFEWKVTPRHDYSKMFTTKLFLCQAEYDGDFLGRYKMHDNGRQTVYLTIDQAYDVIKGMDQITLGIPKIVYLVGWQYNGHDSKYPAFFEGNEAVKRPEDEDALQSVRWLMEAAKEYNTAVSLHINMFDAFEDSPLFEKYRDADVLARKKDGSLMNSEWGYKVCYAAEWEKGLAQERIDRLCSLLPVAEAGTIHIDAFHQTAPVPFITKDGRHEVGLVSPISPWHGYTAEQDMEARANIVRYFDSKGIDVTTEGAWNMTIGDISEGYFPMYFHFNSEKMSLSLTASQCNGVNCGVRAFGNNVNGEQVFMRAESIEAGFDAFKKGFCEKSLICQYLNTFGRKALIKNENGDCIGVFEDGVRTMYEEEEEKMSVAKDGIILASEGDVFIPAVWLGNENIVAFSENGYTDKTWTLPSGTVLPRNAGAWTISRDGRTEFTDFKIKGRQVTLTLAPGQMVLIAGK
ncbi:MAG: endo-alpha-N-acetylgalactosaminidase family protein [Bacteroidales bacterium]|nr:endo-alpha-N-acetylgalactosaminidase family protein [Bacteroidales bacterium]